ncbi:bifunctional 2-polyprenyl-6-hydroxyphenol methylase/3-demethylubiquinol 3-O-methyltransferase UbiG [Thermosynechococcus sp.]|uniref:class I SAM-dependent methyltransferase n=1 Tax=Thermosynechococcus sp. TaxID=2814275 RepID=UPI00261EF332|nr:class I SAM-dependent methyltransferase [Thermosynechococcus sp.]
MTLDQQKIWDYFQNEGIDSFARSSGRLEFLVRRLSPGSRVLNIGIGNGALERMALAKGVDIWSLDPSERAIEALRSALGWGEQAQVGVSQAMPFPDDYFDVVIMSEVLEHLADDVFEATLFEVARVLRPGGRFIGTVPAREKLEDSIVVCPNCGHKFHRWGHYRSFTVETLAASLKQHFAVEAAYETFFIEWESVGWWRKIQGLIKKFLSWRGIGTYGICRNIYFCARKQS